MKFPNPTTGKFTVQSSREGAFIIRDLAGRFIAEGKLNEAIDLDDQPAGVYLIHVGGTVFKVMLK